jgi:hypothetical protein
MTHMTRRYICNADHCIVAGWVGYSEDGALCPQCGEAGVPTHEWVYDTGTWVPFGPTALQMTQEAKKESAKAVYPRIDWAKIRTLRDLVQS